MAVSKRMRFEILRRDGFRCTYCGRSPAETELHVDHVLALSLGGSDRAENLTTACADCNIGKASTSPDAPMVEAALESASAYAASKAAAAEASNARMVDLSAYELQVRDVWARYVPSYATARSSSGLSSFADRWHKAGIGIDLVENAIVIAAGNSSIPWGKKLAYAGGVIRKRIDEATTSAQEGVRHAS